MAEETVSAPVANRYDRTEIAGAFGDLGTLVPFVVAYVGVLRMDPFGVLLAFGVAMIVCGLVYRTPIPVQPMKAAGAMNLLSAAVGGVPMCHGAGGMAGHFQFGARTGGALIMLGIVLLMTATLFSASVGTLLRLFPPAILGVILFLTGAQLALGACDIPNDKGERFALIVTGALAVWNVGIAFVVGVSAYGSTKRVGFASRPEQPEVIARSLPPTQV
jgi:hypothetical protein